MKFPSICLENTNLGHIRETTSSRKSHWRPELNDASKGFGKVVSCVCRISLCLLHPMKKGNILWVKETGNEGGSTERSFGVGKISEMFFFFWTTSFGDQRFEAVNQFLFLKESEKNFELTTPETKGFLTCTSLRSELANKDSPEINSGLGDLLEWRHADEWQTETGDEISLEPARPRGKMNRAEKNSGEGICHDIFRDLASDRVRWAGSDLQQIARNQGVVSMGEKC